MNIRIDRLSLNRGSAEANIAALDRWIADTSDKLNSFASQININKTGTEKDIENILLKLEEINENLLYARGAIMQAQGDITTINTTIADHESRIAALEEGGTT